MLLLYRDFKTAFRSRLSEWESALIMLLYGFVLLWPDPAFDRAGYAVIRTFISEPLLAWVLLGLGATRCVVLACNGVVWQMYGMRAAWAVFSVPIWASLLAGFAWAGTWGLGTVVAGTLLTFDLINAVRATQDAADRRVEMRLQPKLALVGRPAKSDTA